MKIEEIKKGDVLINVDKNGTGYYLVTKVNRTTVDVRAENGNKVRAYPLIFDRAVTYEVPAFSKQDTYT